MPLTLSHPAAVLPLRRTGLSMTALTIGSMVPDAGLFAGSSRWYAVGHSLLGVVTVDVALGLLSLAIWCGLVRDVLVDLSPTSVRSRLAWRGRLTNRQWVLAPLAVAVGALTHVGWDSFTHRGRWGTRHVAWLHTEHLALNGARWAQLVSSAVGLVVVCWAAAAYLRRGPVLHDVRRERVLHPSVLYGVVMVAGVVGLADAVQSAPYGWDSMLFHGAVSSLIAFVGVGLVVAVIWHLARGGFTDAARDHHD